MRVRRLLRLVALSIIVQAAAGKDPNTTLVNEWPMVMVHDAATTYLREGHLLNKTVLDWTITQPPGGTARELDCGARGFDWRPTLSGGTLYMHHGSVGIDYPMEVSVEEATPLVRRPATARPRVRRAAATAAASAVAALYEER
eukprot:COSAG01_NODE_13967_length_1513_cov_3.613154_2_plen_143_part_00